MPRPKSQRPAGLHAKLAKPDVDLPKNYDERIAKLIGVSDVHQLCPIFSQLDLQALVDPQHQLHTPLMKKMTDMVNNYWEKGHYPGRFGKKKINTSTVENILREFFAGVQYSYEKSLWDPSIPVVAGFAGGLDPAVYKVGQAFTLPSVDGKPAKLMLTERLVLTLGAQHEATMLNSEYRFGKAFDNGDRAFLAGVEEGRHMSQMNNSDLCQELGPAIKAFQKVGFSRAHNTIRAEDNRSTVIKKVKEDVERYNEEPAEKDVTDFVRANAKEIKARAAQVMRVGGVGGPGVR